MLKDQTVVPFNHLRTYALSALIRDEETVDGRGRENLMACMHGMLEFDPIKYASGVIEIETLRRGFVRDKAYWGGDAILITVSSSFSAQDVSTALGHVKFVVYDDIARKYYLHGQEWNGAVTSQDPEPGQPSP